MFYCEGRVGGRKSPTFGETRQETLNLKFNLLKHLYVQGNINI